MPCFAVCISQLGNLFSQALGLPPFWNGLQRYQVQGVPKTVINDRVEFAGALPEPRFVQQVLQALEKGAERV